MIGKRPFVAAAVPFPAIFSLPRIAGPPFRGMYLVKNGALPSTGERLIVLLNITFIFYSGFEAQSGMCGGEEECSAQEDGVDPVPRASNSGMCVQATYHPSWLPPIEPALREAVLACVKETCSCLTRAELVQRQLVAKLCDGIEIEDER
ncbi:hypothetical protein EW146_g9517 [Bondarzewia mesenterica]|uniref:Uncharacterized protein n=1 Tax=Bondarzewia mesenterica TaxID=1095465 RepID=A0A4S4L5S4_9AGAM|nr:hypothetical protein EW146_g9517 [Bondarzewia mesenterica]